MLQQRDKNRQGLDSGIRVWGLGLGVSAWGLGLGLGFRVSGFGFRVSGLGIGITRWWLFGLGVRHGFRNF